MDSLSAEARALLALDATPEIGLRTVVRLVAEFGSGRAALEADPELFARVAGPRALRALGAPDVADRVAAGLERARRLGMVVRCWAEAGYPEAFHHLADPPPVLFLRGDGALLAGRGVTIVGARRATARGREVAFRLARSLARAGVKVVSGMALGIDAAAHRGALDGGGDTVAVLGRGADRAYPPANARLFREILDHGLVVSEFLPGTPALPHHFPRRNRLLAALAHTVVVVEAARRSGSLITVEHALDLGLDVYAVPGPIDEPSCEGSNRLLAEGARPLLSIDDFTARVSPGWTASDATPSGLDEAQGSVYRQLGAASQHVEDLAACVGIAVPELLSVLTTMELRGWVAQEPGLRFRRAS